MSRSRTGSGEAAASSPRDSFAGLVSQLTSELGGRLSQEHEARVAALTRKIGGLEVEVSALRSAAGALRLQVEHSGIREPHGYRGKDDPTLHHSGTIRALLDAPYKRIGEVPTIPGASATTLLALLDRSYIKACESDKPKDAVVALDSFASSAPSTRERRSSQGPERRQLAMLEHKPTLQPLVDPNSDDDMPAPPPEPELTDAPLMVRSRTRRSTLDSQITLGAVDHSAYGSMQPVTRVRTDEGGTGSRLDWVRCRSSINFQTPEETEMEENTELFELRGTWEITDETARRMRSKSTTLIVVETGKHIRGEPGVMSMIARLMRSMTLESTADWRRPSLDRGWGRCVMHPQSPQRIIWDLLATLLVAWDFIMVPLFLFVNPPTVPLVDHVDLATHIFWTLDIPASFCTGLFEGSRLIMKPSFIAKKYVRTWLIVDLVIVAPEWFSMCLGSTTDITSSFSALKALRVIRCLRLLRLLKVEQTLREFQVLANSNYVSLGIGIVKLIVTLVLTNHFVACCWYALGIAYTDGWVQFAMREEAQRTGQEPTLLHMYLMSLHWSLTQFHSGMELTPSNWQERVFAVAIVLFALMCISSVLSSMTDMVIELQSLRRDEVKKERILRKYLWEHQISMELSVRLKKFLHNLVDYRQKKESENEIFKVLPEQLLNDLHDEARSPVLVTHQLFAEVRNSNTRACRHICHACIEEMAANAGESVFTVGDACTRMLFIESGQYTYRKKRMSIGRLFDDEADMPTDISVSVGHWVSEAALWTVWTNFGDFTAKTSGVCLALDANSFAKVVHQYEESFMTVALYARRFVRYLNTNPCGDLILSIDEECQGTRRFSAAL